MCARPGYVREVVPATWDIRLLLRAGTVSAVALGLAWLITAATDEGGISWTERAGRTMPLTPACAAIGVWIALAPVCARGEALALGALGRSRAEVVAAAILGGALVSLLAAAAVAWSSGAEVAAFFPRAAHSSSWVWRDGFFVDRAEGILLRTDGAPVSMTPEGWETGEAVPRYGRAAAAGAIAVAGFAVPMVFAHAQLGQGDGARRDIVVAVLASSAAALGSIVLFQSAAAGHVSALFGVAPPLLLLMFAAQRYRSVP